MADNASHPWRRSRVIDVHTHLHPDHLERALSTMERNGLAVLIDISGNSGERFDALAAAVRRYPGRFRQFTGPDFRGFGEAGWASRECERLARAVDAGAVGIKFAKSWGLRVKDHTGKLAPVDDERLAPLVERCGELGCVAAFHTADPKAFFRPLNEQNERWDELAHNPGWWFGDRSRYPYGWWQLVRQLEKVVRRHPCTTILGVHFGAAAEEIEYVADVMRDHSNYIVDIAARVGEIGRHEAAQVREIFGEFQDRILFGTDLGVRDSVMLGAPQAFEPTDDDVERFYNSHWHFLETAEQGILHPTPIQGRWAVDAIDLPRPVLEKLYWENARRWLRL